ncbi:MAG: hypothetical protein Q9159_002214 [Coniocarpon cinnabarinum]
MTSTRDVKDMLGLPAQLGPRPKPSKKGKGGDKSKKGPEGSQWNKELKSLMGERAPPLPLSQGPKWKDKRSRMMGPVRKWRMAPFKNDARTDGLLLRHWHRLADDQAILEHGVHESKEQMEQMHLETQEPYRFAKYNQSVSAPDFSHEEYEEHLKSDRWTEDETRYLLRTYDNFSGKWPLISDRYEWTLANDSSAQHVQRRMEDLKQRFFVVSAKVLSLRRPLSQMTDSEYRDHDVMMKFNPQHEMTRKKIKEQQMTRSQEEQKEEQYLLAELKRIYAHQERFDAELRELRTRIDHSLTDDKPGGASYTTSTELAQLFQRVTQQDKNKAAAAQQQQQQQQKAASQRRSIGDGGAPSQGSPTAATPSSQSHKRQSLSAQDAAGTRNLPPRAEARFGVSTHERLTSGISFVSDKIGKARAATKSSVQNQKIASILGELGIPEIIQMQTPAVCEEMEKLCESVVGLLKTRQAVEKAEGERLVLIKQLEMEGVIKPGEHSSGEKKEQADEGDGGPAADTSTVQEGDLDGDYAIKTEDEAAGEDAQTQPSGRKRSASNLSATSASSRGGRSRKSARK